MSAQQPNPFAPHWLIRDIVIGSHMAAVGPGGLLFVGDSIVEGFYWNRIRSLPVVNAGYSGIWTEALQPKVQRLVHNARPCLVVLLVGTNDAKKGQAPEDIEAVAGFYEQVVDTVGASGVPLIAVTPPPVEPEKRLTGFYSAEAMSLLSRRIAQIARSRRAAVVDLHAAFRAGEHVAEPGATVDGIHLAPQAYRRLHAMLEQVVADRPMKT